MPAEPDECDALNPNVQQAGAQESELSATKACGLEPRVELDTYTDWLIAEVQVAIDDTSPTIAHEEAMRIIRAAVFGPQQ